MERKDEQNLTAVGAIIIGIYVLFVHQQILPSAILIVSGFTISESVRILAFKFLKFIWQDLRGKEVQQEMRKSVGGIQQSAKSGRDSYNAGRDINIPGHLADAESSKREKHFGKLTRLVFKPWYDDLFSSNIFPDKVICEVNIDLSENINKVLFKDVENHFPEIMEEWEKIKSEYENYVKHCKRFIEETSKKIEKKTSVKVSAWTIKFIYEKLLNREAKELEPRIEKDGKSIRSKFNSYIYAEDREKKNLEKCLSYIKKICKHNELKKRANLLKDEGEKIKNKAKEFDEELQTIIYSEKELEGDCKFIK